MLVGLITSFSNPADIETLINDVALVLLPKPLSEDRGKYTQRIDDTGLAGLWGTVEYEAYIANPDLLLKDRWKQAWAVVRLHDENARISIVLNTFLSTSSI